MSASIVLIAVDMRDAHRWEERTGTRPLAVVTPRSTHAARGHRADAIAWTQAASELPTLPALLLEVRPCLPAPLDLRTRPGH